ncbi:hypothetical protein FI667_g15581, partial [Globisporangium splendens]
MTTTESHPDAAKMAGIEGAGDCVPETPDFCGGEDDLWTIDPGSNAHVIGNKQYFVQYRASDGVGDAAWKIEFVNGTAEKPVGIGTIACVTHCKQNENLFPVFTVDSVLYLPNVTNLFSPGLGLQQGFEHDYDRLTSIKKIYQGESAIIEAKLDEDIQNRPFRALNNFLSSTRKEGHKEHIVNCARADGATDLQTWHFRLARTCKQCLTKMVDNGKVSGVTITKREQSDCDMCQLVKQLRKSPQNAVVRDIKHPNESVYADLLSPGRYELSHFGQMLVTMDGYSEFLTLYLLRTKAETNESMTEYIQWGEQQASPNKVKATVADRGSEVTNSQIAEWYNR